MLSVPSILAAVEALALPRACLGCEKPLREGDVCCAECRFRMGRIAPPVCSRCSQPLDAWDRKDTDVGGSGDRKNPEGRGLFDPPIPRSPAFCGFCQSWPPALQWARSAVWLDDGPARELVHALKYGGWTCAALPMADLIARECGTALREVDALVPIPLGRTRLRERGHNQAAEIAMRLGVVVDGLTRARETPTQTTRTRTERWSNVAGAFAAGPGSVTGLRVAVVDDVLTTGATLAAAAVALKAAGAVEVGAITFGRAVIPT